MTPSRQPKPDTNKYLAGLKDFQRATVDYVYHRLYEDDDCVDRFLIADEVGLGKTLVARGVIAKAVDKLWQKEGHRIDIIYICANRDIARQNINRLNITGDADVAVASRMTLLPLHLHQLQDNRLNFVSFTPNTSFNLGRQGGIARERMLLYYLLQKAWGFGNEAGPKNLLQVTMGYASWRDKLARFDQTKTDDTLRDIFVKAARQDTKLCQRFEALVKRFSRHRKRGNIAAEDREAQLAWIGEVRRLLAKSCVGALEPDIVILDEFQRFKYLLEADDDMALLAQALFNYQGAVDGSDQAKTLLLSATPYKMYTMHHERAEEDHYADFIRTTKFLFNSAAATESFQADLQGYRQALFQIDGFDDTSALQQAKSAIESRLRQVMVRTERLASTLDRDAMVESHTISGVLEAQDLSAFATLDQVAQQLEAGDVVEYWKSAPYVLNLMERSGYQVKRRLMQWKSSENKKALLAALKTGQHTLLDRDTIQAYRPLDPGNAKLRALLENTVNQGAWQLLWTPPSLFYYQPPAGPYADPNLRHFSKSLIFSTWQIVPKVIAALCSYEAEREMVTAYPDHVPDYKIEREKRDARLVFNLDTNRQPASMSTLTLLYPCVTLATQIDPLHLAIQFARTDDQPPTRQHLVDAVTAVVAELLEPIIEPYRQQTGQIDQRWYWVASMLLDQHYHRSPVAKWLAATEPTISWKQMVEGREKGHAASTFVKHLRLFRKYFEGDGDLGRPPDDLAAVLAKAALGAPAITALRALLRSCPASEMNAPTPVTLAAAARVAMGFRSLFNLPESITLIRALQPNPDTRYWESVLNYCLDGNLQAVLDEYVHILLDALGLQDSAVPERVTGLSKEIQTAVSIRTVNLGVDQIQVTSKLKIDSYSLRCRFALRFGNDKTEDGKDETRPDQVRAAFNSPFAPFILATTSVGQEGLDFHHYCHQVYHWNLPSNPVDLEQREGRVHRYKGHVIRRNLASDYNLPALAEQLKALDDPWRLLFDLARAANHHHTELVPYWIFEPVNGGPHHKVRRYIPALPLSRDHDRLKNLRHTLVAYRMVFGQPRQEDLVNYLQSRLDSDLDPEELFQYRINLSPISWSDSNNDSQQGEQ